MDSIIQRITEQRELLRDIQTRTVERIAIMRAIDERHAGKRERKENLDHKEIKGEDEEEQTMIQRTFFDVRTAARFSALRSQRLARVGG